MDPSTSYEEFRDALLYPIPEHPPSRVGRRPATLSVLIGSVGALCFLTYAVLPGVYEPPTEAYRATGLDGLSSNTCNMFTDGTCAVSGCFAWRGQTECVGGIFGGLCKCKPGFCANAWGVCVAPPDSCPRNTGGTCKVFPCDNSHGSVTCVNGECLCAEGACSNARGFCDRPPKENCPALTDGTCAIFGCDSSRGPTVCKYGRCLCLEGTCATVGGKCMRKDFCTDDTGGSCKLMPCAGARGPTSCQDGRCICDPGFCAKNGGMGYGVCQVRKGQGTGDVDEGLYVADVVGITKDSPYFPYPHNNVNVALCISGGGARALSWALGVYRSLTHLGLMKYVDAVSSVSGGTWASAIYMFSKMDEEDMLGAATSPASLTPDVINARPAELGAVVTTGVGKFLKDNAIAGMRLEDVYVNFVAQTFLGPHGIGSREAFMARSEADVRRIKRLNPELEHNTFLTPRENRPNVFVMGGMVTAPIGYRSEAANAVLLQMSPDYTGSPFFANNGPLPYKPVAPESGSAYSQLVGGGLIESFAFGGRAPDDQSAHYRKAVPTPKEPFSLALAVGISSMGPSLSFNQIAQAKSAIPRRDIWPITKEKVPTQTFELGDAGNMENSGLLAMLQRKAKRVALWLNTNVKLDLEYDFCAPSEVGKTYDGDWISKKVDVIYTALFGSGVDNVDDGYLKHNQVFDQSELAPAMCELQTLRKAGKPCVIRRKYKVLSNDWWGIQGGFDVDLVFTYAEKSEEFEKLLPIETQRKLPKNYPYYDTGTGLSPKEVNLVAAQSEYTVMQNENTFRDILCPEGPLGICCRNPSHWGCNFR